jgi:FkbM family methyltransferase
VNSILKSILRAASAVAGYDLERSMNTIVLAPKRLDGFRRALQLNAFRHDTELAAVLSRCGVNVVLDVGANEGQFGATLRERSYAGRIHSFEPVAEAVAALQRAARNDAAWQVHACALGADNGTLTMNVARDTKLSSVQEYTDAGVQRLHQQAREIVDRRDVPLRRLDAVLDELLVGGEQVLLKLDTQGYNRAVYEGMGDAFSRIACIQTEASLVPLYGGAMPFDEELALLAAQGFHLASFQPVVYDRDLGIIHEADCIFVRRS